MYEDPTLTKARRTITAGSLLLILAIAIACGDDEASVAIPTPLPNASNKISFQTFLSGHNSGLVGNEPAVFKIETQAQWAELWSTHRSAVSPKTAPPAFSFEDQILVAVFDRQHSAGGVDIKVQVITRSESSIVVEVVRTVPGPGCVVLQAFTVPFDIVSIDDSAGEVQLVFTDSVTDCS